MRRPHSPVSEHLFVHLGVNELVCGHHAFPVELLVAHSSQTQLRRPLRMTTHVYGRLPQVILRFTAISLGLSDCTVPLRVGFEALFAHVPNLSAPSLHDRVLVRRCADFGYGPGELLKEEAARITLFVFVAGIFAC